MTTLPIKHSATASQSHSHIDQLFSGTQQLPPAININAAAAAHAPAVSKAAHSTPVWLVRPPAECSA